jgi:hypothetical protein
LWLDADTFRLETPKNAPQATVADAQRVLEKLQKQPAAIVLVFGDETSRYVN